MSLNKRLISGEAEAGPIGFRALSFTGNGSTQTVTGMGFQPDIVCVDSPIYNIFSKRSPAAFLRIT